MRSVIFVSVFLYSCAALSQDVAPLLEGDPAPFDGVLLSKDVAAGVIVKDETSGERCDAKIEYKVGKAVSECELYKGITESKLETETSKNTELLLLKDGEIDRLNKSLESSGTDWGPVWFVSGAAVGVAASLIIFFISVQTVKVDIVNQ